MSISKHSLSSKNKCWKLSKIIQKWPRSSLLLMRGLWHHDYLSYSTETIKETSLVLRTLPRKESYPTEFEPQKYFQPGFLYCSLFIIILSRYVKRFPHHFRFHNSEPVREQRHSSTWRTVPSSAWTSKIRSSKIQTEDERNQTKKLPDLVVEIGIYQKLRTEEKQI